MVTERASLRVKLRGSLELAGRLRPEECSMRVPAKGSRRVLLQLAKEDASSTWRKLTAM